jgi:biotin-dependent carboxylase-like uncharacterized protein
MTATLKILSTGVGLSLQDGGRCGWRRFGVPTGGAMDRHALAVANHLLGNPAWAPALELLWMGARIQVLVDTWVALAGADTAGTMSPWTAQQLAAGTVLEFPRHGSGLFSYLALPGGIVAPRWFGSSSTDSRIGFGRQIEVGHEFWSPRSAPLQVNAGVARRLLSPATRPIYRSPVTFELLAGPQFEQFSRSTRAKLVSSEWRVSARSDRTGFRLEGPKLSVPASIASEPVLAGSFQIPGSGQPIVTMVDGPTVGGYAKLAILRQVDRNRLAQCAPGTVIYFKWADC